MSEDLNRLEREVEAALASFSADLPVEPPDGLIQRVRTAVRLELNEAWLAAQPTPAPSPPTLQRVRDAVREELRHPGRGVGVRGGATSKAGRRFARLSTWASVAAAAMIGLAVGIVHYVGSLEPGLVPTDPVAEAKLDLFVQVSEEVLGPNPSTASIRADLDVLEESINRGEPVWNYETSVLSDIVNDIDARQAEPDAEKNMSRYYDPSRGAFG